MLVTPVLLRYGEVQQIYRQKTIHKLYSFYVHLYHFDTKLCCKNLHDLVTSCLYSRYVGLYYLGDFFPSVETVLESSVHNRYCFDTKLLDK